MTTPTLDSPGPVPRFRQPNVLQHMSSNRLRPGLIVSDIKIQEKSQILFCKILKHKWYHAKVLSHHTAPGDIFKILKR